MKIDVTGIDLIQFIKEVYKLSVPAGLGYLHFRKGELTNEEAKEILAIWKNDEQFALDIDYLKGRACKITIFRKDRRGEKIFIYSPWYDHTDIQLKKLLKEVWPKDRLFPELKAEEHGISCHCVDCQSKRETKS